MTTEESTVRELLRVRPIAVNPMLIRLVRSHSSAIFLAQAIYWEEAMGREYYKTTQSWCDELYMSRDVFENARRKAAPYVRWTRRDNPAKNYYSIDWPALYAGLAGLATPNQDGGKSSQLENPPTCLLENPPTLTSESISQNNSKTISLSTIKEAEAPAGALYGEQTAEQGLADAELAEIKNIISQKRAALKAQAIEETAKVEVATPVVEPTKPVAIAPMTRAVVNTGEDDVASRELVEQYFAKCEREFACKAVEAESQADIESMVEATLGQVMVQYDEARLTPVNSSESRWRKVLAEVASMAAKYYNTTHRLALRALFLRMRDQDWRDAFTSSLWSKPEFLRSSWMDFITAHIIREVSPKESESTIERRRYYLNLIRLAKEHGLDYTHVASQLMSRGYITALDSKPQE